MSCHRALIWFQVALLCFAAIRPTCGADTPTVNESTQVKLIMVGDIMVAKDEETGIQIEQGKYPFQAFAKILKAADVSIGNLECVIAEKGVAEEKPYTFLAQPRVIPLLKQHFTGLSVANNHSCDFGKPAFVEQCERLEKAQIPYFGGGRDLASAHRTWIIERNGLKIAMLGYCEVFINHPKHKITKRGSRGAGIHWSAREDWVPACSGRTSTQE